MWPVLGSEHILAFLCPLPIWNTGYIPRHPHMDGDYVKASRSLAAGMKNECAGTDRSPDSVGALDPWMSVQGRHLEVHKNTVFSVLCRASCCPLAERTGLNKCHQPLSGSQSILGFVWQCGLDSGGCAHLFPVC